MCMCAWNHLRRLCNNDNYNNNNNYAAALASWIMAAYQPTPLNPLHTFHLLVPRVVLKSIFTSFFLVFHKNKLFHLSYPTLFAWKCLHYVFVLCVYLSPIYAWYCLHLHPVTLFVEKNNFFVNKQTWYSKRIRQRYDCYGDHASGGGGRSLLSFCSHGPLLQVRSFKMS